MLTLCTLKADSLPRHSRNELLLPLGNTSLNADETGVAGRTRPQMRLRSSGVIPRGEASSILTLGMVLLLLLAGRTQG